MIVCGHTVDACLQIAEADVEVKVVVNAKIDVNAKFGEVKTVCKSDAHTTVNGAVCKTKRKSVAHELVVSFVFVILTVCNVDCALVVLDKDHFFKLAVFVECLFFLCECNVVDCVNLVVCRCIVKSANVFNVIAVFVYDVNGFRHCASNDCSLFFIGDGDKGLFLAFKTNETNQSLHQATCKIDFD